MQISKYRLSSQEDGAAPGLESLAPEGPSIRFGNDLLVLSEDPGTGAALESAAETTGVSKERLHVVVQNGRLFQQHNPQVPVIHDRGRFLLVDLDPEEAQKLGDEGETCYGIVPAAEGQVVFEENAAASSRRAPGPFVQELVDKLSRDQLEANLVMLTSFFTRNSKGSDYVSVSLRVKELVDAMNYETRFQDINVQGRASRNVIAEKAGSGVEPRDVVIITAHLDSINLEGGDDAEAPGADDNGSGSAGLLEIARVFQDYIGEHDLRLIWFGGEEQGLFGSKQYVAGLSAEERGRIKAVVNMDMIGCPNTEAGSVLIEGAAVSQKIIDDLSESAAAHTGLAVETSLNPFASDHVPFIRENIPAVLTIEGADSTNTRVHSALDSIETINYDFALEILRMNVGYAASKLGAAA